MALGLAGLLLLGLGAGSIEAAGTTYYVSMTDGVDSNSGLSATPGSSGPFKTIARINNLTLQPSDSVRFKCGDTWRAEMAAHATNIYVTDLGIGANVGTFGCGVNQLFKNTQRLPFGHWPNLTEYDHGYSTIDS